jgi:hypothetical protein
MKEICIPLVGIPENDTTEVIVQSGQSKLYWRYRVERFAIAHTVSAEQRIQELRLRIKKYDPHWELIQIMDTNEQHSHVHILYRERKEEK